MNHAIPFSLHIFVADGDPDGLRFVTRDNWIGKAIVFPRSIFLKFIIAANLETRVSIFYLDRVLKAMAISSTSAKVTPYSTD